MLECSLCFIGLVGMIDPVRDEVKTAINECQSAGIRPIMITGDHRDTAVAIAKELNIIESADKALTGAELSALSDEEFDKAVEQYSVYARVQPEHKTRIVKAWQKLGKITAMTGDTSKPLLIAICLIVSIVLMVVLIITGKNIKNNDYDDNQGE